MTTENTKDFYTNVEEVEKNPNYQRPLAFGVGIATLDSKGNVLECFFPAPNYNSNFGSAAIVSKITGRLNSTASYQLSEQHLVEILSYFKIFENDGKKHTNLDVMNGFLKLMQNGNLKNKVIIASFIAGGENDQGPQTVADAYLRLHLLSHRLVKPHGVNLTGVFKVLPNVAWTSEGAIAIEDLPMRKMECLTAGRDLTVSSVDKFPKMTDYVVPTGVRIADASRVRLGAYLGEGTTVMQEGFINFNAGCEGPNMIEGRISAGVFVKKGSDLGGGCSTMGTLSGGGNIVISIGEDCLLGANSGCGIPLGNGCTIEAGLYLTAGTKIALGNKVVKASVLANKDNILFRRNSQTGVVEAISKNNQVSLNEELHDFNG
jgi:2,3,4,5-tetrahydropyridine-2-carboxylate N-succinyltransferase